ncbi:MAG: methyltransferase [Planctomycetota bacterium]|nr:methyltransferase [Planctomycetota bacterium]
MGLPLPEKNVAASTLRCTFGKLEIELDVPEGVWNPTPNGILLGELLESMDFSSESILELGTGCGVHAVVLGLRGAREMLLTDIDEEILSHAKHNLDKHGIDTKTRFLVADWVQVDVSGYDTLIANPPYCVAGKDYRRYFIDTLILEAHKLVRPGGRIIFIHSTMADSPRTIQLMEECRMTVRILAEKDYPFRDYYFDDQPFMLEMAKVPGSYTVRNGVHHERLMVFEGTLPED